MCGICGIFSFKNEKINHGDLKKMNDLLIHRGPDDEGFYVEETVGIAMRRLSIIDLESGKQPISNETNDIITVFNGEIYNFKEIKNELLSKGHKFKTKTDTEVIVHLYEEMGTDFPKKLRGMFAVALWDKRKKRLVLTRDRLGKKPLFYYIDSDYFAFSSEIDSLISFEKVKKTINLTAIDSFLTLQYIPAPSTIYKEVKKLEQAETLVIDKNGIKNEKYWEIEERPIKISFEEAKDEVKRLVEESVKLRMISDVPIGAFLSGGIDSSVVVSVMARNSPRVKTFSIGFKEEKYSELNYAKELAEMYSTEHTEFIVEEKMTDALENLVKIYNQPFADPSALPSYYVSKITSKYVKVALNGDGGDENFAGYSRYQAIKILDFIKRFGPDLLFKAIFYLSEPFKEKNAPFGNIWKLRKFLRIAMKESIEKSYISSLSFFDTEEKNRILTDKFKKLIDKEINYSEKYLLNLMEKNKSGDIIKSVTKTDIYSYLSECLMTKMDMASMSNSLETRSPLLDHKLTEFAQNLPSDYKLKGFTKTKFILKEAFKNNLPDSINNRGKMGFGIPLGIWFRGELKKKFEEYCLSDRAIKRGYFDRKEIERLWEEHQSFKRDHGYKLWALLMLEIWHSNYFSDFKI
ncbi:MAG TPA: asparagine synthase (glutamine-hydrolyzing) [Elusimicrobiales bacterium]|nr:asparagine synthase (glutamine-hydrolyzing) [Elusimicrobiales bacterium]HPO95121.1 asparagine synthase (glutamine-hydrolyzing) [Elusimicrobiales bacterium]